MRYGGHWVRHTPFGEVLPPMTVRDHVEFIRTTMLPCTRRCLYPDSLKLYRVRGVPCVNRPC